MCRPLSTNVDARVVSALREVQHVVVLTGSGASAESGVPTFRESQVGLWERFDAMELATPAAFRRDPPRSAACFGMVRVAVQGCADRTSQRRSSRPRCTGAACAAHHARDSKRRRPARAHLQSRRRCICMGSWRDRIAKRASDPTSSRPGSPTCRKRVPASRSLPTLRVYDDNDDELPVGGEGHKRISPAARRSRHRNCHELARGFGFSSLALFKSGLDPGVEKATHPNRVPASASSPTVRTSMPPSSAGNTVTDDDDKDKPRPTLNRRSDQVVIVEIKPLLVQFMPSCVRY